MEAVQFRDFENVQYDPKFMISLIMQNTLYKRETNGPQLVSL